jgi:quercetin dioxygenase-like cupin family protein
MAADVSDAPELPGIDGAIRRVVVGIGADGRSTVVRDEIAAHQYSHADYPGVTVTELWSLHPGDRLESEEDVTGRRVGIRPNAPGESRYYSVRIEPGQDIPLHVTPTVDYHVCVAGEVTCVLETGEITVRAGDVLVVKGGPHGWRTPANAPYVSFAVMVGGPDSDVRG